MGFPEDGWIELEENEVCVEILLTVWVDFDEDSKMSASLVV